MLSFDYPFDHAIPFLFIHNLSLSLSVSFSPASLNFYSLLSCQSISHAKLAAGVEKNFEGDGLRAYLPKLKLTVPVDPAEVGSRGKESRKERVRGESGRER